MLYIQFFKRNRLRMVRYFQRPPRHAHEVSLVYFKNCEINGQRKFLLQIR